MNNALRSATPIDQEVTGDPVEAHGYLVTPVARMRGRLGSTKDERSSGSYGWVAIRPLKVTVQDRNGNTQEVRLVNTQAQAIKALAILGVLLTLFSALLPVLSRAQRQQNNETSLGD